MVPSFKDNAEISRVWQVALSGARWEKKLNVADKSISRYATGSPKMPKVSHPVRMCDVKNQNMLTAVCENHSIKIIYWKCSDTRTRTVWRFIFEQKQNNKKHTNNESNEKLIYSRMKLSKMIFVAKNDD